MTRHEQGFMSANVERAVSVQKWRTPEPEYKIDLLAIQEVRGLVRRTVENKECTIYYSCDDKRHIFGTGFFVRKRIRSWVIDF
jgi:hypothetical protein